MGRAEPESLLALSCGSGRSEAGDQQADSGPQRRGEAQKLIDQFEQKSAAAKQVLAQLRDGESTLLELWLLAKPRGKGE